MRTLVTGATGFVGSHLVEALVTEGHDVRALVRRTSDSRWIRGLPVEWCWGEVGDSRSLSDAVEGVDWVLHVAGVTKARGLAAYVLANAEGTRHVMEACVRAKEPPKRVVLVSSLAAWGPCSPTEPRHESDLRSPVSHYGLSKAMAEEIALSFADRVHLIVLRPTAVYGPRDRDVLSIFRLARRGWNLAVGGGERHICMLHVTDLVRGILRAAVADVPSGSVFPLSDGENHTWTEIVGILERVMGVRTRTVRIPVPVAWVVALLSEWVSGLRGVPPLMNRQKLREMVQPGWTCQIRTAVEALGFRPQVPIEEGLRETYLWYREQGWI